MYVRTYVCIAIYVIYTRVRLVGKCMRVKHQPVLVGYIQQEGRPIISNQDFFFSSTKK